MDTLVTYPPINIEMEPWVSATQISTFELCNRKWAWKWLEKIYAPPDKFMQLGIDTHGALEGWLKYSRVPAGSEKDALLAQALIPYLPAPQSVIPTDVERDELIVIDEVLFIVKIDLFMPQQLSWDGFTVRPRVYDHKTSKDPEKWAPKPHQIQFDIQAALYAAWTMIYTKETEIDLQWNYVKSVGAVRVVPVCATVTEEMIMPRMLENLKTARQIRHHVANTKRALDVVPDPRACDEYGGCPFKDRCNISGKERIVAIMSDFKNQPATQQFLAGVAPPNGQPVNPPQFAVPGQFAAPQPGAQFAPPPAQPQFAPPAQPQFAPPQQQPQFAPPAQPQFAPPQQQPQFAPPAQPQFAPPQQQPQFAPPAQPQFAPPPAQPQFAPPPAQPQFAPPAQPQFAPPAQPQFAPPAQPQFAPPPAPQQVAPSAPAAEKGPGRPTKSKEYDMTGAWAKIMSGAIQLTGGDVAAAALLTDKSVAELKARQ